MYILEMYHFGFNLSNQCIAVSENKNLLIGHTKTLNNFAVVTAKREHEKYIKNNETHYWIRKIPVIK